MDVKMPALVSCKPRVSEFQKFTIGSGPDEDYQIIYCYENGKDCRKRITPKLKETYQPEDFVAVATLADGEDGGRTVNASLTYSWVRIAHPHSHS